MDDAYDDIAQYDGEDEDDDDNRGGRRDEPLLPVFSEFLGMCTRSSIFVYLLTAHRPTPHLRHDARHTNSSHTEMRDHIILGPVAVAAGIAVPGQAHPAADSRRPFHARYAILPDRQLLTVPKRGG
jgi:hypothetical protein